MKKLLNLWFGKKAKYSLTMTNEINKRIMEANAFMPIEFQRKVGQLKHFRSFNGNELRALLFYIGIGVFKPYLSKDHYDHFLLLVVAISILLDKELCVILADEAQQILKHFVEEFGELYGAHNVTHNVHMLLHLSEDVKQFNCPLDEMSAFPFESYMSPINGFIGAHHHKIQQVETRVTESFSCSHLPTTKKLDSFEFKVIKVQEKITGLHFKGYNFDSSDQNSFVLTKSNKVFKITEIALDQNEKVVLKGKRYYGILPVFELPMRSSHLNIFKCVWERFLPQKIYLDDIQRKMFAIPLGRTFVVRGMSKIQ